MFYIQVRLFDGRTLFVRHDGRLSYDEFEMCFCRTYEDAKLATHSLMVQYKEIVKATILKFEDDKALYIVRRDAA